MTQAIVASIVAQLRRPNPPTVRQIAESVGVSVSAVYKLLARIRDGFEGEGDNIVFVPAKRGRRTVIDAETGERVKAFLTATPTATISDAKEMLETGGVRVCRSTVWRMARREGLSHQMIAPKPAVVFTPRIVQARHDYAQRVVDMADAELWFIDESGFNLHLGPRRCWAEVGHTPVLEVPTNRGKNVSLLMCVTSERIVFSETKNGAYRAADFVMFLQALAFQFPAVQRGDVCLVMDNARIHHAAEVNEFFAQNQIRHLFLPPYSPDLNPIENAFGVLKRRYAQRGVVRTRAEIERRIARVIQEMNMTLEFQPFFDRMREFVQRALNRERFN